MPGALTAALDIVDRFAAEPSPARAALAFYDAIQPFGAIGIGTRVYDATKGSASHKILPGITVQSLPPKWLGSASAAFIESLDPLPAAARRLRKPAFMWSEATPRADRKWREYWDAASEHGWTDGLAVHVLNPNRTVSRVSFGLKDPKLAPRERLALEMAANVVASKMSAALPTDVHGLPRLSPRERDCLSFAAQGMTDAQIGEKLGIAETTAHTYVELAKRKLGVRTRAQAVAHLIATGQL